MKSNQMLAFFSIVVLLAGGVQGSPIEQGPDHDAREVKNEEMLIYLNRAVHPCDDFYEFSCGNYGKYHKITPGFVSVSPSEELDRAMDVKTIRELQIDHNNDTPWDTKVKSFFRSCTVQDHGTAGLPQKLKEMIAEFGQMPALSGNSSLINSDFDWLETIGKIAAKTNEQIILAPYIIPDYMDNTRKAGRLGAPVLSLGQKHNYNMGHVAKVGEFIRQFTAEMQNILGMDVEVAKHTAKEVYIFEALLARGIPDPKENLKLLEKYVRMEIDDVQKEYLEFWDTKKLFTIVYGFVPNVVYVERTYLDNVKESLKLTTNKVWANYIFYRYMQYFTKYLNFETDYTQEYIKKFCFIHTKEFFYENLDNLMYRRLFNAEMKKAVSSIWQDMKTAFENIIESPRMSWISADTRQQMIMKLHHMEMQLNSYENKDFAKKMKDVQFQSNNFLANIRSVYQLNGDQARAKATQSPHAGSRSIGQDSTFSALYDSTINKVHVPIAYLTPGYHWSDSYSKAYNFASLGFYLAHEMIHGFDEDGRFDNMEGYSHNSWDTRAMAEFLERKQCFAKQYANFTYAGTQLGEQEAQDENICDNGGVHIAYEAYMRWYAKALAEEEQNLVKESLPGLNNSPNYTPGQVFFISYAQLWCHNVHDSALQQLLLTNKHMPKKFRVIGPLANMEAFSKEFSCPIGSLMNPPKKCVIY